tara:strand:- start:3486 stop:3866 length:381 start_codon:yes stop_codon:yes gene_type:complete
MGLLSGLLGNASIIDNQKLEKEFEKILIKGEKIEAGFKIIRDLFIFSNKRLILVDKQGLTGKKMEYLSIAYKSISKYSVETAGTFDLDAELKIWVYNDSVAPSVSKKFNRSVNVYEVQKILSKFVL